MIFEIKPHNILGHSFSFWYWEVLATLTYEYGKLHKLSIPKTIYYALIAPIVFPLWPILGGFLTEKLTYKQLLDRQAKGKKVVVIVHSKRAQTFFKLVGRQMDDEEFVRAVFNEDI